MRTREISYTYYTAFCAGAVRRVRECLVVYRGDGVQHRHQLADIIIIWCIIIMTPPRIYR